MVNTNPKDLKKFARSTFRRPFSPESFLLSAHLNLRRHTANATMSLYKSAFFIKYAATSESEHFPSILRDQT